jgi:hypothetical protein
MRVPHTRPGAPALLIGRRTLVIEATEIDAPANAASALVAISVFECGQMPNSSEQVCFTWSRPGFALSIDQVGAGKAAQEFVVKRGQPRCEAWQEPSNRQNVCFSPSKDRYEHHRSTTAATLSCDLRRAYLIESFYAIRR